MASRSAADPERGRERTVGRVDPPLERLERRFQGVGGRGHRVGVAPPHADAAQAGRELAQADGREVQAERVGGDVGERVGFVEHDHVVFGEHVARRREVRAVQRVVHHQDVGGGRPFPGLLGEAVVAVAALGGARTLTWRAARRPARAVGDVDVGEVAGRGLEGEALQPFEVPSQGRARPLVEHRLAPDRGAQLRPAHVLRATLQQCGGELHAAVLVQVGEVLAPQLVLQGERRGRHDDAPARRHRGGEVREALARSGRRFGDEVMVTFDRVGYGRGETVLARAVVAAECRHRGGEDRARVEAPGRCGCARAGFVASVSVIPRLSRVRGYAAAGTGSAEATGPPSLHNSDEMSARSRENPRKIRRFGGRSCKAGQQPSPFPKESQ